MKNDKRTDPTPGPSERKAEAESGRDPAQPEKALDLDKLDLTVEEVEERVHPSETNVFDK